MNLVETEPVHVSLQSDQSVIQECARQVARFHVMASRHIPERRAETRQPYPELIELRPVEIECDEVCQQGEPLSVVGKQLGTGGFDFFHHSPIPFRHALVSFDTSEERSVEFILRISWCRFLGPGWYESGGRFIRLVRKEITA